MNRQQIKTRILNAINDNATTPVFFSTAQLNNLVDEGMEVIAENSRAIHRTAMFALRPGTTFYSLASIASDIMLPVRLWDTTRETRLTALSMQELDKTRARWLQSSGTPEVWFPVSWDLFGLYPATSTSGGLVRMDYIAWPRELIDDNDEPELPLASHDALVLYGAYLGLLKKWDSDNAKIMLKALEAHVTFATARSGINKMSSQITHREVQPGVSFPSDLRQ